MPTPPFVLPNDLTTLPFRITTREVLAICRYGRVTLTSRIKAGKMPEPVDRGGAGDIFLRDEVLRALKLIPAPNAAPEPDPWEFNREAFRALRERGKRANAYGRKAAQSEAERLAVAPAKPMIRNATLPPKTQKSHDKGKKISPRDLGPYVRMKLRTDGTFAVTFGVPDRYRPSEWPASIHLPIKAPRTGDLNNKDEVARIRTDAADLLKSFHQARGIVSAVDDPPASKPTRLRSIMKQLGPYVVIRPRKDGTYYVYQFVPLILRPKGWKATIPLPLHEPRTGDLRNKEEFSRIRADAATLHQSLTNERIIQARHGGRPVGRKAKTEKPDA